MSQHIATQKIPLERLLAFIEKQPEEREIKMNEARGIVGNIATGCFIFQFFQQQLESNDRFDCGYSSMKVKDGVNFELGVNPEERQVAFDINLACIQAGDVNNYGRLRKILQEMKEGKITSKTTVIGMS